ncbi:hypothetical protein RYZ26_19670 [Terasakiella sp. A23]|uniref:hypothetical protein n=1 Tax=Terasakiella sp. FCG-A23 TaxID=3080561 RepID=UPI002953B68D|nr:hypothetical protein [Terasakiella sp. A23]MDV7341824.1 hypothetical protein [Terasakiella sp. A23]
MDYSKTPQEEKKTLPENVTHLKDVKKSPERILSDVSLRFEEAGQVDRDIETILSEIEGQLNSEKIDALIESCQRNCLGAVVRPFGIARVLFEDKDGGNVDTIHNARKGVYATDKEKNTYAKRGEYDDKTKPHKETVKNIVHSDDAYKETNKKYSEARQNGGVKDAYADATRTSRDAVDLDHIISAKQTHDDPARVLAEKTTQESANIHENLVPTAASINRSKKAKSPEDFARWLEKNAAKRKARIDELSSRDELSDKEKKELTKLKTLDETDPEAIRAHGENAKSAQDRAYNMAYYTSGKFIKNAAYTSAKDGGKMALQQALGGLMEEFIRATFVEVKDVWKNGFKGSVDDKFLAVLKTRLKRVAERVQSKWKDAAYALKDGFISGFFSNLITVLINAFATTAARLVRMIREGVMSLYRAVKTLVFPEKGMTLAEAADAALKILASGLVTAGGIAIEEAISSYLAPLGPLADYVSIIAVGLITGVSVAGVVYLLDEIDLFNVQAKNKQKQISDRLSEVVHLKYEQGLEDAKFFDGPESLHLT